MKKAKTRIKSDKVTTIRFDENTLKLVDRFAKMENITRSKSVRLLIEKGVMNKYDNEKEIVEVLKKVDTFFFDLGNFSKRVDNVTEMVKNVKELFLEVKDKLNILSNFEEMLLVLEDEIKAYMEERFAYIEERIEEIYSLFTLEEEQENEQKQKQELEQEQETKVESEPEQETPENRLNKLFQKKSDPKDLFSKFTKKTDN